MQINFKSDNNNNAVVKPKKSMKDLVAERSEQKDKKYEALKNKDPNTCKERVIIVMDDSGSMGGKRIESAKLGYLKLLHDSDPSETAYGLIFLNTKSSNVKLTCDYKKLMYVEFTTTGTTPLGTALFDALKEKPSRLIVISDGAPDDKANCFNVVNEYAKDIPIDTIFIYDDDPQYYVNERDFMKKISEMTGGIFMSFDNIANFIRAVGLLNPANRDNLKNKNQRLLIGSTD